MKLENERIKSYLSNVEENIIKKNTKIKEIFFKEVEWRKQQL